MGRQGRQQAMAEFAAGDARGDEGLGRGRTAQSDKLSQKRELLLDRGFVYAIAHIRGGSEMGRPWYEDGKLLRKCNTFTDFIAAAEHLIAQRYTTPEKLVIEGGSAGGLLMGAVANIRPDLFRMVISHVPFVDVLNTMLDKDLPLTPPEWPEWGNPIASKEDFKTILSYSPCENVVAKPYPHIFAYGGLTDPRVTYWEPAKWIARLRELNTSDNLILLKINMDAGHGGASGRYEQLKEIAADYAFALKITGKAAAPAANTTASSPTSRPTPELPSSAPPSRRLSRMARDLRRSWASCAKD